MEEEKIIKLVCGELPENEKQEVLEWVKASLENKELFYKYKNAWALATQHNTTKKAAQSDVNIFIDKLNEGKTFVIVKRLRTVVKYAAAVLIAFVAGKLVFEAPKTSIISQLDNEICVPLGQMAKIKLPDGSSVLLNSGTILKYPASFNTNAREVSLSGEAYFEVAHSVEIPFYVKTNRQRVKVLGTKFNVMEYPSDASCVTTLVDGKVAMMDGKGSKIIELHPGQQFNLNTINNTYEVNNVEASHYTSWKDGIYILDHETLGNLATRLERIYAVKIKIQDKNIEKYRFSGKILRSFSIEQVLKIIKLTAPIDYKIIVHNDGSREVTLMANKKFKTTN